MSKAVTSEINHATSEQERLAKLKYYEILDTAPENSFEQIALLAKQILEAECAFIAFVGENGIFFKSWLGSDERKVVAETFLQRYISRASLDDNNFVLVPIQSAEGYILGYIGAAEVDSPDGDKKPLEMMKLLSNIVMDKLEERIGLRKLLRINDDRLHVLIHDLKNPMTTIGLQSELLGKLPDTDDKVKLIAGRINNQSRQIVSDLNHILSSAKRENSNFKPQKIKIDVSVILSNTLHRLNSKAAAKQQDLIFNPVGATEIIGDPDKLLEVFFQLTDNAIKFSPAGSKIELSIQTDDQQVTVQIKDEGTSLSDEGLERLFFKFADVGSYATAKENTSKIGLQTAKLLVDMHKGKIWAERVEGSSGTVFYVQLPLK